MTGGTITPLSGLPPRREPNLPRICLVLILMERGYATPRSREGGLVDKVERWESTFEQQNGRLAIASKTTLTHSVRLGFFLIRMKGSMGTAEDRNSQHFRLALRIVISHVSIDLTIVK
jgi:hypothetical protein